MWIHFKSQQGKIEPEEINTNSRYNRPIEYNGNILQLDKGLVDAPSNLFWLW
jgi:hypothetical protein